MVLWLKELQKKKWFYLVVLFVMTCMVMWPYFILQGTPIEHDTFFHISRIEHLSQSIAQGNFLPVIYPSENQYFGYASPLFYSDIVLIIPACLHLLGVSVSLCYRLTVIVITFLSAITMYRFVHHITKHSIASYVSVCAYLFSNYRITDIYVRGALGELFAFIFIPMILHELYRIIEENDISHWYGLTIGLVGILLSHNLSFLLIVMLCVALFLMRIKKINKTNFTYLVYSVLFAFFITVFFTIPMIEQLQSQNLVVHYYGTNSNLSAHAMDTWQYFAYETIFGYSGNQYDANHAMTVNVGYVVTFVPLLYIFCKQKNTYITMICIVGYILFLLPSTLVPWHVLPITIIQFPWRLNMLALPLLCCVIGYTISKIEMKPMLQFAMITMMSIGCIYHTIPVLSRTFIMLDSYTWQDIVDGKMCDPYYGTYYIVPELGGADYLPFPSINYREYTYGIQDEFGNVLDIAYTEAYDILTIDTSSLDIPTQIVVPRTWYKGYVVYDATNQKEITVNRTTDGLVSFYGDVDTIYTIQCQSTLLRKICMAISSISIVVLIILI